MSSDGPEGGDVRLGTIADEKTTDSLLDWLSVTDTDGNIVGVWWDRLATLALGSWLLSVVVSVAEVMDSLGRAWLAIARGIQSWYADYLGALVGVAISVLSSGYEAAESFLSSFGFLSGPIGIAVLLLAVYLWVTIE